MSELTDITDPIVNAMMDFLHLQAAQVIILFMALTLITQIKWASTPIIGGALLFYFTYPYVSIFIASHLS